MFGYVKPVRGELLVREYEYYRAVYCGICCAMKKHTGMLSRFALTYDSVFFALVRMLYLPEKDFLIESKRCIAHPAKKRGIMNENPAIEYTARAAAVLTYFKLDDDLHDEGLGKKIAAGIAIIFSASAKGRAKLDKLSDIALENLTAMSLLEEAKEPGVDKQAELFGRLLGEFFAYELPEEEREVPYRIGFHLGKFIYAADAAEDYEKDKKSGAYNPFVLSYGGAELTDENRKNIRNGLLLECESIEAAANLLPFGDNTTIEHIITNIIHLGLVKRIDFLNPKDESETKT